MVDRETSNRLIDAVRKGNIKTVRELLASYSLSSSSAWSDGYVLLRDALQYNRRNVTQLLLTYDPKVNSTNNRTTTPLHFAVINGDIDIVQRLLDRDANINAIDKNGKTPLHTAVEIARGHTEVVMLLLERGADVDIQDKDGKTVLWFAVENRHSQIVEQLLKYGAYVKSMCSSKFGDGPLLQRAVARGHTEVVKLLLESGADVHIEDEDGRTALWFAVKNGHSQIVEQLLKYGAHVNSICSSKYCDETPLQCAVAWGHTEVVKLLLERGADVDIQMNDGRTVLWFAVENGHSQIVEQLLKYGAHVNSMCSSKFGDGTLLHRAVARGHTEVVKLLLERGADVDIQDKDGRTTLHAAICKGYVKLVEALLEYNADVNLTCAPYRTPLSYAAEKGNEVITKMLLNKGANINAKDKDGRTALHIATEKHHKQVVEVLLKFGARVDSKTTKGSTPLHIAVRNGDSDIAKVLVTFSGDIDSKDEFGATALHSASKKGETQIVLALLDHGADITIMFNDRYTALDLAEAVIRSCYSHRISAHTETAEILKLHMVRLKTANLYARNQHLLSIISDEKFSSFQNECEEEIISMKSENVGNANITFYNILTKGISQLAVYAGNESVVQVLRSKDYEVIFPIYASTISTHFRNWERRRELLEEGNTLFHSFFNFLGLPHVCTERIFNYLSDADLRTLMDACKPINVSNPDIDINNVIKYHTLPSHRSATRPRENFARLVTRPSTRICVQTGRVLGSVGSLGRTLVKCKLSNRWCVLYSHRNCIRVICFLRKINKTIYFCLLKGSF